MADLDLDMLAVENEQPAEPTQIKAQGPSKVVAEG